MAWWLILTSVAAQNLVSVQPVFFDRWLAVHGRTDLYREPAEYARRLAIYEENTALVAGMNAEDDGAVYSVDGPFADLSVDEFRTQRLMRLGETPTFDASRLFVPSGGMNESAFDWRDFGAVSAVRDQGALGSCWAFGVAQNVEGQLFLSEDGKKPIEWLSVEQLIECDANVNKEQHKADCGEFGGWPYLGLQYIVEAGGLRSEAQMPYCAGAGLDGGCLPCMPEGYSHKFCGDYDDDDQIPLFCNSSSTLGQGPEGLCASRSGFAVSLSGWKAISSDEVVMAQSLTELGPLSVVLNAQRLQFYRKGVYNPYFCNKDTLDHAVLLVGFGQHAGADYWTVKNSWGESWGEAGFFRINRGDGMCGINTQVVTGIL